MLNHLSMQFPLTQSALANLRGAYDEFESTPLGDSVKDSKRAELQALLMMHAEALITIAEESMVKIEADSPKLIALDYFR